jgi:aminoacrylate hydrolase
MAKVKVDGDEIFYEVHGNGPPLLLVSGLGGVLSYWKPMLPRFVDHFRVILHDHRGTGQSARTTVSSVEQMAGDLLAVMDDAGVDRALYVGHSTGGVIGQVMAIEHPERLAGMVLSASWPRSDTFFHRVMEVRKALLDPPNPEAYVKAASFFMYPAWYINANKARLDEADARAVKAFTDPKIMASRIDAILAFDRQSELGRIRIPTLALCAKDDFLTPSYFSEELSRLIPGCRLQLLERGGHGAAVTEPEPFIRAVLEFLMPLRPTVTG